MPEPRAMADVAGLPARSLVIGGTGLLGRALLRQGPNRPASTWNRNDPPEPSSGWHHLDLADRPAIDELIDRLAPPVIVNAAYSRGGDDLESVTAQAPGHLAAAAARTGTRFVHLSTDVVFAGDRQSAYVESDRPDPVHQYGRAKADSEGAVVTAHPNPLVIRTSLLYGSVDGVQEQLVAGAEAEGTVFFTDEVRAPAHVDDLAAAIGRLVAAEVTGTVHLAGADAVDRLRFAQLLAPTVGVDPDTLRGAVSDPELIRPRHVVLASERLDVAGVTPLPGCGERLGAERP
ncbi:MAG: SDR family oxidoreductase [Acidimicrobiales bacterium]